MADKEKNSSTGLFQKILDLSILEKIILGIALIILVASLFKTFSNKSVNSNSNEINIGLDAELSGELSAVGQSSKQAAEMAVKQINDQGGLEVDGKKYPVKLNALDNGSNVDTTKTVTEKLISDGVLAIVGPNASKFAIEAGKIAEEKKVVLVSPWSTNPQTTLNEDGSSKKYVKRAAFVDPFQGQALAVFATKNLQNKTAAVMYDETASVLKGQSDYFQTKFKENGGEVVDVQTFKAGDKDFTTQLTSLLNKNPQVIFLPAYYQDAAAIIKQAKNMGITVPFLGSDAWGSQELLSACADSCEGFYLSAHYSADSKDPATQKFVTDFQSAYSKLPDDVAALTYDSLGLVFQAIRDAKKLDREALANALSKITTYSGVTGTLNYKEGSGDPTKTVVILKIEQGKLNWAASIEP